MRRNRGTPLAKKIEVNKAAYFEDAEKISKALIAKALEPINAEGSNTIAVINTLSVAAEWIGCAICRTKQNRQQSGG